MARGFDKAAKDFEGQLTADLNALVQLAVERLSSEEVSPVLTGFFASSWKASTTRPRARDERERFSPWDEIKTETMPNGYVKLAAGSQAIIRPRHSVPEFKPNQTIFIGNTVKYATDALASPKSKIIGFLQGEMKYLIDSVFTDKKSRSSIRVAGAQGFTGTSGGMASLLGSNTKYVSYMTPGETP